jgi:DNA-binding beta-propeller fold protein YncE
LFCREKEMFEKEFEAFGIAITPDGKKVYVTNAR